MSKKKPVKKPRFKIVHVRLTPDLQAALGDYVATYNRAHSMLSPMTLSAFIRHQLAHAIGLDVKQQKLKLVKS